MNAELILIREYCIQSRIEPDFIIELENEGLIELYVQDEENYIHVSQLKAIEQYARFYYDLSINIAGIDVIHNLLEKIEGMQKEINGLKQHIKLLE